MVTNMTDVVDTPRKIDAVEAASTHVLGVPLASTSTATATLVLFIEVSHSKEQHTVSPTTVATRPGAIHIPKQHAKVHDMWEVMESPQDHQ